MSHSIRGSMLISVIFMMLLMAVLMSAMVSLTNRSSRNLAYETMALRARLAADSVLENAIYQQMAPAQDTSIADIELDINGCSANAGVNKSMNINTETLYYIRATGSCGSNELNVVRTLEVEVIK
ncbi:hypothetical protein [Oceanisphaera arctica]|uniref:MSHA biogenesis protein MshP n=1 Tax=Oceanisphaera arctica TaxID=641510 RepID=A0A2P5TR76_9GAMM|nr:hypothetical protein [Oceanisphaera arctica]PPL18300.1 hypothetical protein UN63_01975 [Oceanisphaera arctica]GHA12080.1 hypothetical protein GCM10007082_11240 [Oceanisphaera arctica]